MGAIIILILQIRKPEHWEKWAIFPHPTVRWWLSLGLGTSFVWLEAGSLFVPQDFSHSMPSLLHCQDALLLETRWIWSTKSVFLKYFRKGMGKFKFYDTETQRMTQLASRNFFSLHSLIVYMFVQSQSISGSPTNLLLQRSAVLGSLIES